VVLERVLRLAKAPPRWRLAALAGLTLLVSLLMGSAAGARGLTTGFIDEEMFPASNPQVRNLWLSRAKSAGAGVIRISVPWRQVVGTAPPRNPTDPSDPDYAMGGIDTTVKAARAMGFQVLLTTFQAPEWAEGKNEPSNVPDGTWKPDPKAFGQFGQMLAKRYSGKFPGLPKVNYFEAWNEPNLSNYLTPQWKGKQLYSPSRYRQMLNAFYAGVKKVQPRAKVLGGSTAPFGDDRGHHPFGEPRMRPLEFLRKLFCLKGNNKPTRCPTKPHLDILSHHPVNIIAPPTRSATNPDDVVVADFHNLRKLMHAAERAGNVRPKRRHQLWATEIWWFSKPPNSIGAPLQEHARWLEQALYMLWKQGASTVINYEIRDAAPDPSVPAREQVTTGLFFSNGKRKPAYTAWRFPFVTHRKSKAEVGVWGKAPESGKLQIQEKRSGGWHTLKSVDVKRGKLFTPSVRLRGKADLRGKLGADTSIVWHQH
jgi:hypothetical protein